MLRLKKRLLLVGAVLVVGGAAVAIAYAAIPSGGGVITACYMKSSGALRVIDAGQSCKNNEQNLSWNIQGAKGDPGETGETGEQGLPGPSGLAGIHAILQGYTNEQGAFLQCPDGEVALGGGYLGALDGLPVLTNAPQWFSGTTLPVGWDVVFSEPTSFQLRVICVPFSG